MIRLKKTPLAAAEPRHIMIRGANWVGDAVMSLPLLAAVHEICPQAELTVLARPWVSDIYAHQPGVSRIVLLEDKIGFWGPEGLRATGWHLQSLAPDWIILLPHSFRSALQAWFAGAKVVIGYNRDGRRFLLTHPVARPKDHNQMHQTAYYLNLLLGAGLPVSPPPAAGVWPKLYLDPQDRQWAHDFLARNGLTQDQPLVGIAPGANYGPAKCWPVDRFAAAAAELAGSEGAVLLFGGPRERALSDQAAELLHSVKVINLTGYFALGRSLAFLEKLHIFIANDSGLMHASAALGIPTVAVFGSTNPVTTAPLGPKVKIVRKPIDCAPCKKPVCPRGDMACFASISVEEVTAAGRELIAAQPQGAADA